MRVTYWPDVDILDIRIKETQIKESDEICEGIVADYDMEGNIVSLEIFDASHRVTEPQNIVFESMGHPPASRRASGVAGGVISTSGQ
jgi:uncharacterized protein YuzE